MVQRYAQLKDVPIKPSEMEYVLGMVQSQREGYAQKKDVPTLLSKEEYVLNMGRSMHLLKLADVKDVTAKLRKEEYVNDMVRRILHLLGDNLMHRLFSSPYSLLDAVVLLG